MEGTTNFSRCLQAVRNRNCWVFGNRWRIRCNLKRFDGLSWLSLTIHILRQIYATARVGPTWLALRNESKKVLNSRRHSSSWNVVSSSQKYAASSTRSDSSSLTSPSNSVSSSPANWTQPPVIILDSRASEAGGMRGISVTPQLFMWGILICISP